MIDIDMSDVEKDKIISSIYHDESGYGSIKTTYSDARLKSTITLKYVQEWFKETVGTKAQPVGTNSLIAPYAHYEYQIDLFLLRT